MKLADTPDPNPAMERTSITDSNASLRDAQQHVEQALAASLVRCGSLARGMQPAQRDAPIAERELVAIIRAYAQIGVPLGEDRARRILPQVRGFAAAHRRSPGFRELMGWWLEAGPSYPSPTLN